MEMTKWSFQPEPSLSTDFKNGTPFPHVIIDQFLNSTQLKAISEEVETSIAKAKQYRHYNQKKWAVSDPRQFPDATKELLDYLTSEEFIARVEQITGYKNLLADPDYDGGGIHISKDGGFLNVHTDFLSHPRRPSWKRVINLIIYLNDEWKPEFNGQLELWDPSGKKCLKVIEPKFNRAVMFETNATSFHGHPHTLHLPEGVVRKSLALYYFVETGRQLELAPTFYVAPEKANFIQRTLVVTDRLLIKLYSRLRRFNLVGDHSIFKKRR